MNRIEAKFKQLKKEKRPALITYICAGDPDLKTTGALVLEMEKSGADIIELGVPFSDPIADGPVIQRAALRALKKNTSLKDIVTLVGKIRKQSQVPILLMTYVNPVYRLGPEKLAKLSRQNGIDGYIIPDLPPEAGRDIQHILKQQNIDLVFLASPLTGTSRLKLINKNSSGFIYYVSVTGVTGARKNLPEKVSGQARELHRQATKPVAIGFGVSNAGQVKKLGADFDGVIVGSAIVNIIEQNLGRRDLVAKVGNFVKSLRSNHGRKKS
jgi:tryptophan synthase alpha chain